jgi:hypothetical protein
MCLNELRDTINFNLWLMDKNLRVSAAHCINFARLSFFAEEGSLTDADADLHCGGRYVVKSSVYVTAFVLDHLIVVAVNSFSSCLVTGLPLLFLFFLFFKSLAPFYTLLLHFLDVVHNISALLAVVSFHLIYL